LDPEHADFRPSVLRDLDSPVPLWPIGACDQFVLQLHQERLDARRLDRLERDPVDTRRPVVPLGEVVRSAQRLQLDHVDVQAPEPPAFVSLRLEEAGEHRTPRDAVRLMAKLILLPIASEIESTTYLLYDGACGPAAY
jgi:hypothetical protein